MARYKVNSAIYLKRTGKYYTGGTELEVGEDILQSEINFIEKSVPKDDDAMSVKTAPKTGASTVRKGKRADTAKPKK